MRRFLIFILGLIVLPAMARAEDRFPPPEFRSGYQIPATQFPRVSSPAWAYVDVAVLGGALLLASWLVLRKRSRRGVFLLTLFSVVYFGFWRKGCVCSIGSIQNVAMSLGDPHYVLPWMVGAFFLLPLAFALFAGRVFCSGVCPLGAIQDLVLWRPVKVPYWLEVSLGLFAYFYLGIGVLFAAMGSDFVICRYDPFVGFFRLSGSAYMLFIGAAILLVSMFVGRTYCRFICPYGVVLRLVSPFAKWRVKITPAECVDCRLCEDSCPFGAIRKPTPLQKAGKIYQGKGLLVGLLVLLPVMVGGLSWLGYRSGGALAKMDGDIQLADRIWKEEKGLVEGTDDASKAFRDSGRSVGDLYSHVLGIQRKYGIGGSLLGAWMGSVIGLKLIGLTVRRRRGDYSADAGTCVACGRCYQSCPVEHERLKNLAGAVFEPMGGKNG